MGNTRATHSPHSSFPDSPVLWERCWEGRAGGSVSSHQSPARASGLFSRKGSGHVLFLTPQDLRQSLHKAKSHKTHTLYRRETGGKEALGGVFQQETAAAPQRLCFGRRGCGRARSRALRHLGSVRREQRWLAFPSHLGTRVTQQLL